MQMQAKIGGILYNRDGKLGGNYPDLEPGLGTWFRLQISNMNGIIVLLMHQQKHFIILIS